ncbi:conjugal transfer protein [Streptomyces sp. NPDC004111]|uniref:conjugal transfer protein n=1 Tax=Streptomyces sp. NPDC004111 TaxID=3364690 RepID=UPI0036C1FEDC
MSPRSTRTTSSDEAPAPVADRAALGAARRRVSAGRMAVWGALAAGPAALVLAVLPAPRTVAATPKKTATVVATPAVAADPSGYAELLVSSWLASSTKTVSEPSRRVQAMAPGTALPDTAAPATMASAISVTATAPGRWQVTVAATAKDGAVRYFALPVTADGDGRFAVPAGPAQVAAPAPAAEATESGYPVTVPTTGRPLAATVAEFLTAYLSGGQIDRYAVPGVRLSAPQAAYRKVEVEQLGADEQAAAAETVAADNTRVRVRVRVRAEDTAGGAWPLDYGLALTARAGRWEISAVTASGLAGGAR